MTLDEVKKLYDKQGALNEFYTVKTAKAEGIIPADFAPYIADECECGSENIIKGSRTQLLCCDPHCCIKQGYKLAAMFSKFNVDGIGPETCKKVYTDLHACNRSAIAAGMEPFLHTKYHLEVLTVPWEKYPASLHTAAGANFYQGCQRILSTTTTFPDLIGKLGLRGLGGNSAKLFSGINSYQQFKDAVNEKGSLEAFCAERGFYSAQMMFDIRAAIVDIQIADKLFSRSMRNVGLKELDICITGNIKLKGKSLKKSSFIEMLNKMCTLADGTQLFEVKMNSAIESNPFVLYSTPSNSAKFVRGQRRSDVTDVFGTHKVLMTVDDFYDLFERKIKEWTT